MRHLRLTLAAVAALVMALPMGPAVLAQAQATDADPIVGTWATDVSPSDGAGPDGLTVFLPGGVVLDLRGGTVGAGTWSATGANSADVTIASPAGDPGADFAGFVTIRASVEVSDDGQTFSGTYTLEFPAGLSESSGLPAGELGPGDVTGQKVALEPMGTPVGPIPGSAAPSPCPCESPAAGASAMPAASPAVEASGVPQASPMAGGSPAPEASPTA
jgi:hypothetical protein